MTTTICLRAPMKFLPWCLRNQRAQCLRSRLPCCPRDLHRPCQRGGVSSVDTKVAPTSSSYPSSSSSLLIEGGLRGWLIRSTMSLSCFSLSGFSSSSFSSSLFVTYSWSYCIKSSGVAAAATLVPFRVSVMLKK